MIGKIPGKAKVKGDSVKNDTVNINVSPGEIVVPRTVVSEGPEAVFKFVMKACKEDAHNYAEGGKVEPSMWDKFTSAFEEDKKPKKKTPVRELDQKKAKDFASVFNSDDYAKGGVVQNDGWEDVSHELPNKSEASDGWEDVSQELYQGDEWKPTAEAKEPESRAANAALQGFGNMAAMGYMPQLSAAMEPKFAEAMELIASSDVGSKLFDVPKNAKIDVEPDYIKRRDSAAKYQKDLMEQEPGAYIAGSVGGGLASGIGATAVLPSAAAATAAGRIAKAGGIGALMAGLANPGEKEGELSPLQPVDRIQNAGLGFLGGSVLQGAGEGISKAVSPTFKRISELVKPKLKGNAAEIRAAAKELGIEPSPGMLNERGGFVERMEDSLQDSPSMFGSHVRDKRGAIQKGMTDVAQDMGKDASNLTPFQIGENFKSGIGSNLDAKSMPISKVFDDVAESTRNIPVGEKSLAAVGRNIEKDDLFRMLPGGKPAQFKEMLSKVRNANDIKTISTLLGKEIEGSQGAERAVLSAMKEKLSNLEKNSITRAAIQSARESAPKNEFAQLAAGDEGQEIAKQLVGDLKGARTGWRGLHEDMNAIGKPAGINSKGGPEAFKSKLEAIPSQNIQDKFLNPQKLEGVNALKEKFPEQFKLLQQGKLRDVMDASLYKGDVSAQRFVKEAGKLDPEIQTLLFGENTPKIQQMQTLVDALPAKFNPSGTSGQSLFSLQGLKSNVADIPRFGLYKAAASDGLRSNVANKASSIAAGADALTSQPTGVGSAVGASLNPVKPFDEAPSPVRDMDRNLLEILGKNPQMIDKIQNPKLRDALRKHLESKPPKDPRQSFLEGN